MNKSRPLLGIWFLATFSSCLSCVNDSARERSDPTTVPAFYRLTVFLDSSLPRVPNRLVSGGSHLWQLSGYRNSGQEWWRCRDPGNPVNTIPQECLANNRSWGSETSWWNNIPPPRIQRNSGFQIFFFNSSRDPLLEGASAKMELRIRTTDGRGRVVEADPLNSPRNFILEPFPASYGGVDSQAWAAPSISGFFRVSTVGRYELFLAFEPQGQGPRFFLASVLEVVP